MTWRKLPRSTRTLVAICLVVILGGLLAGCGYLATLVSW